MTLPVLLEIGRSGIGRAVHALPALLFFLINAWLDAYSTSYAQLFDHLGPNDFPPPFH